MDKQIYQADLTSARELLFEWITKSNPSAADWVGQKQKQLTEETNPRNFFLAFGAAPRFVGKEALKLTEQDLLQAQQVRAGLHPENWTVDQAARILFVLSLPHSDLDTLLKTLNQVFSTADVGELTALYLSLPLLPYPEAHRPRASEGIRTNMTVVFNAIALDNPYPNDYMEEGAFNQLVLKAIFIGSPLKRIIGLDQRSNPDLAQMLTDFAHERWAAKRQVPAELWRPVAPYLNQQMLPDLERLFTDPDPQQQRAAALACASSQLPEAKTLLSNYPELEKKVMNGEITWENIS